MSAAMLFNFTFLSYLYATQCIGKRRQFFMVLFWLFMALSNLAIGMSAILIPLLTIIIYHAMFKAGNYLYRLFSPTGIILFLAITIAWFVIGEQHYPNFTTHYFLQTNAFSSIANSDFSYRQMLLLLPILLLATLPWSIFLINAIWVSWPKSWAERFDSQHAVFFMLWLGLAMLELALVAGKIAWIIAVAMPINILIARYLTMLWEKEHSVSAKLGYDILLFIVAAAILVLLGIRYFNWFNYPQISMPYMQLMLIVMLAIAIVALPIIRLRSFKTGFTILYCANLICLVALSYCYPYLTKETHGSLEAQIQYERQAK